MLEHASQKLSRSLMLSTLPLLVIRGSANIDVKAVLCSGYCDLIHLIFGGKLCLSRPLT